MSATARLAWSALILATLYFCYFHNLGAIGLVGPDEPRYAWIARDMAETGDWVTPRLYGQPWFEKPPLYYWGAVLSFKLFGVSEVTARLPSAVAALLATLALAGLAWRVHGTETARWLLLLLPTTVGMIGFSHAAATDMPFAAMLTIAMVFAAFVLRLVIDENTPILRRTPWLALILFGFFLGLAALAKGPAALALSGGAVLLWATFTKRWRDARGCLHPLAIASFCVTALPWYILCARRNPEFLRVFIIQHNFERYLTPEFQHVQPFWFYLPILLISFLPWTPVQFWVLYDSVRQLRQRKRSPLSGLLLCWSLFCLIFFSISRSKLPGYILPAIPAIGLLFTERFVGYCARLQDSFHRYLIAWTKYVLPISALLLLVARYSHFWRGVSQFLLVVGCALFLFTMASLLFAFRLKPAQAGFDPAALCVLPVLLILLTFHFFSGPWLSRDPSGRTLSAELRAVQIPPPELYVASMKRGQQYSLSFYLHREIPVWNSNEPKQGYLLLPSPDCDGVVRPPALCVNSPTELGSSGWFVHRVETK